MPQPLYDGSVEYEDGTPATASQVRCCFCSQFLLAGETSLVVGGDASGGFSVRSGLTYMSLPGQCEGAGLWSTS